ncbi:MULTISPECIES: hypothetical protein [Mammaliicoccus]|uniref:hypothetical protein n=1 Tax=Mammaliicoccus sp. JADD-157 TaxID=3404818 RepID=UPI0028ECEF91|nr:hypothetical protein [Mammaliicoccus lentus]
MDYKKEMKKMGWNEEEIAKRMNSLAKDKLGLEEDVDIDAESLKQSNNDFIETDGEQEVADAFFNDEEED